MATIVHFEIPSDNIEDLKKFYHELFGWKIDKWSGSDSTMEYWMTTTRREWKRCTTWKKDE